MSVPQVAIDAATRYLQKGDPRGPAIGVVAVLYAGESHLNPGSQGTQGTETGGVLNPHGAFGINSANGVRQNDMNRYALGRGVNLLATDPTTALNIELDWVITEMFNSYHTSRDAWIASLSYEQFIPIFVADYERPANPTTESARSIAFARLLDAALPQVVPITVAAPSPVVLVPAPVLIPTDIPIQGVTVVNPAILSLLDAFANSLAKAFIAQLSGELPVVSVAVGATPTPAPIADIAPNIAALIASELSATLPGLIATELVKLVPTIIGAKT